jgi:hypothetical protein
MIIFRKIRGRAAGHVVAVNPLNVREIRPLIWGGADLLFDDLHTVTSRDPLETVIGLLEGRARLCTTQLCDRLTDGAYVPKCPRCILRTPRLFELQAEADAAHEAERACERMAFEGVA